MTTLQASQRPESGKGEARKLRAKGKLPGVVYGPQDPPFGVEVDPAALTEIFKKSQDRNTIVQLEVAGETLPVLVREVQRHPVSRDILHVDFYRVSQDRDVEVMVPLKTTGRPRGAVLGGRLRVIRRTLRVRCRFDRIPSDFTVDVSPLGVNEMIRASQVPLPEGVALVLDSDFPVISVVGKRVAAGSAGAGAE